MRNDSKKLPGFPFTTIYNGPEPPKPVPMDSGYQKEKHKLDQLVSKSNRVLMRVTAVFPFDFFPNTVVIDENKVDLVYRTFFFSQQVFSILTKNINFVTIEAGPIFATLIMEVKGFEQNPLPIRYLWKNDAIRARRMIMGLVACAHENINLSVFTLRELKRKVEEIGIARGA